MRKLLSLTLLSAAALGWAVSPSRDTGRPFGKIPVVTAKGSGESALNRLRMRPASFTRTDGFDRAVSQLRAPRPESGNTARVCQYAIADNVNLRGSVIKAGSWGDQNNFGIYALPHNDKGTFDVVYASQHIISAGFDDGHGTYYATYLLDYGFFKTGVLQKYNSSTWEPLGDTWLDGFSLLATDVARDPSTGDVYGCYMSSDGSSYAWGKGDYAAATSTAIKPLEKMYVAVGCDENGQYYAVDEDLVFYKVDKTTGDATRVNKLTLPGYDHWQYLVSGCVNDKNHTFLMSSCTDSGSALYEIDLATGAGSLVTEFPDAEEVVAMYIAAPATDSKAPGTPDLSVTSEKNSMEARIDLTMSTTFYDGSSALGESFNYTVTANGKEIMQGNAQAGESVSKTVTMEQSENVTFEAKASNSHGTSTAAKRTMFVGVVTPNAPRQVSFTWNDGTARLEWDAVTQASDGETLNNADVTYNVLDASGTIVASGISDTAYSFDFPNPLSPVEVYYSVQAVWDGKTSSATESNRVLLGELSAPMTMNLKEQNNFERHTYLDVNEDYSTWCFEDGRTCYRWNPAGAADDWLFTPAIKLEGGHAYRLTADAAASDYADERIEIFAGKSADPEGMTELLVPATPLTADTGKRLTGYLIVPETGRYHLGFHAISDENAGYLYLDSYEISEPISGTLPRAVSDATVEPDPMGALKAKISFSAPDKAIDGSSFTGNVKVRVLRGEEIIKETQLAAGEKYSFYDEAIPAKGDYRYTFITLTVDGTESVSTEVAAFIGLKVPANIDSESVTLVETAPGTFELKWGAVTTADDGSPINPDNMSYKIYSVVLGEEGYKVGEELATVKECSYTYVSEPLEAQALVRLAVHPYNGNVCSELLSVGTCLAGKPYEMPVVYTSPESLQNYFMLIGGNGTVSFATSQLGIPAQDGDDAFFRIDIPYAFESAHLITGKINISGTAPVLSFYTYNLTGLTENDDINETIVSVILDGQETEIAKITKGEMLPMAWNKIQLSLKEYIGKTIQIKIAAYCPWNGLAGNLYDNIRICEDFPQDLSASISAPAEVEIDKEFGVKVTVANEGSENVESYTVDLYRDGEVVESRGSAAALAPGAKEEFVFSQKLGVACAENVVYAAAVNCETDMNGENDKSDAVNVTREISSLPTVTGLAGETVDGHVHLSWDKIVTADRKPAAITEDFESAEAFAQEFSNWTFVDKDGSPVGGFKGITIPGIIRGVSAASFFVADADYEDFDETFAAHSGSKYLASLFRADDGQADDWAISPLLPAEAQTISFFARSFQEDYPENIEVWYTTEESVDPADFVKLDAFGTQQPTGEWKQFSAELPEGTRHFAIRSCASESFMLMIDDVEFTLLDGFDGKLLGYNIYRNGAKINEALCEEPGFIDLSPIAALSEYAVSARYDKGESELCSPLSIDVTGIESIARGDVTVRGGHGFITVKATDRDVRVNSVDGALIYQGHGSARIPVSPGIYLVKIAHKTYKVIAY